jgi:hypothetical protein
MPSTWNFSGACRGLALLDARQPSSFNHAKFASRSKAGRRFSRCSSKLSLFAKGQLSPVSGTLGLYADSERGGSAWDSEKFEGQPRNRIIEFLFADMQDPILFLVSHGDHLSSQRSSLLYLTGTPSLVLREGQIGGVRENAAPRCRKASMLAQKRNSCAFCSRT